jgi:hypothetical protein
MLAGIVLLSLWTVTIEPPTPVDDVIDTLDVEVLVPFDHPVTIGGLS